MYRVISELHENFPKDTFKSYTINQGKEFACYSKVESNLKLLIYFADASFSWLSGRDENVNGLLREELSRKTDLAQVAEERVL